MRIQKAFPAVMVTVTIVAGCGLQSGVSEHGTSGTPVAEMSRLAARSADSPLLGNMAAPLAMTVTGSGDMERGVSITVEVTVSGRLDSPIELRADLPPGAVVDSGTLVESLVNNGPAVHVRQFRIRHLSAPVRFTASSAGNGFGATAAGVWPAESGIARSGQTEMSQITPVDIAGVRIDRAVRIGRSGAAGSNGEHGTR